MGKKNHCRSFLSGLVFAIDLCRNLISCEANITLNKEFSIHARSIFGGRKKSETNEREYRTHNMCQGMFAQYFLSIKIHYVSVGIVINRDDFSTVLTINPKHFLSSVCFYE